MTLFRTMQVTLVLMTLVGFPAKNAFSEEVNVGSNLFELVHHKIRFVAAGSSAHLLSDLERIDFARILDHENSYPIDQADLVLFVVRDEAELAALRTQYTILSPVFDDLAGQLENQVTFLDLKVSSGVDQRSMRVYFLNISRLTKTELSSDCVSRFVYASSIFEDTKRMLDHIGCAEK